MDWKLDEKMKGESYRDAALGIGSTGSAWVLAAEADAGTVWSAFGVPFTFARAALDRVADESIQARADGAAVLDAAPWVGAARRRVAVILSCGTQTKAKSQELVSLNGYQIVTCFSPLSGTLRIHGNIRNLKTELGLNSSIDLHQCWNHFQKVRSHDRDVLDLLWRPWTRFLVAGVHDTNGSPLNPLGHWQTVTWLRTSHSASTPHDVEQGLMHLELTHTLFDAHSSLPAHPVVPLITPFSNRIVLCFRFLNIFSSTFVLKWTYRKSTSHHSPFALRLKLTLTWEYFFRRLKLSPLNTFPSRARNMLCCLAVLNFAQVETRETKGGGRTETLDAAAVCVRIALEAGAARAHGSEAAGDTLGVGAAGEVGAQVGRLAQAARTARRWADKAAGEAGRRRERAVPRAAVQNATARVTWKRHQFNVEFSFLSFLSTAKCWLPCLFYSFSAFSKLKKKRFWWVLSITLPRMNLVGKNRDNAPESVMEHRVNGSPL